LNPFENVERGTDLDIPQEGLRANMKDHYFLRQSEKNALGIVEYQHTPPS
jgi:hypothetical protein